MSEETERLDEWGADREAEEAMDYYGSIRSQKIAEMQQREIALNVRYDNARRAKVGSTIICPVCEQKHTKTTYNKIFCSNGRTKGKGQSNCKDSYWNAVDERKKTWTNVRT
jgi:hypothetical protein